MAESNNSAVSIVAILAIVVLVGAGLYFIWFNRSGESPPDIQIQVEEVPLLEGRRAPDPNSPLYHA
jgi:hypothetical protein